MKFVTLIFLFIGLGLSIVTSQVSTQKDTVQALVVSSSNTNSSIEIDSLSGEQIIDLIDSLLSLDQAPSEFISQLNEYIEAKAINKKIEVALTGFNDKSIYPSNNAYKTWDHINLYPYKEELRLSLIHI